MEEGAEEKSLAGGNSSSYWHNLFSFNELGRNSNEEGWLETGQKRAKTGKSGQNGTEPSRKRPWGRREEGASVEGARGDGMVKEDVGVSAYSMVLCITGGVARKGCGWRSAVLGIGEFAGKSGRDFSGFFQLRSAGGIFLLFWAKAGMVRSSSGTQ